MTKRQGGVIRTSSPFSQIKTKRARVLSLSRFRVHYYNIPAWRGPYGNSDRNTEFTSTSHVGIFIVTALLIEVVSLDTWCSAEYCLQWFLSRDNSIFGSR